MVALPLFAVVAHSFFSRPITICFQLVTRIFSFFFLVRLAVIGHYFPRSFVLKFGLADVGSVLLDFLPPHKVSRFSKFKFSLFSCPSFSEMHGCIFPLVLDWSWRSVVCRSERSVGTGHFGVGRDFLANKYFLRGVCSWVFLGGGGILQQFFFF